MRLTRVHVEVPLASGQRLAIEGTAANHITRVLRLRAGDGVTVFNGNGAEFSASIEAFRKDSVVVAVKEQRAADRESPVSITLAQGISRGDRMDWIIQKATELAVSRIVPVLTERSVVRLDAKQAQKKVQHWRGIAIAACEQCGRNRVPEIALPSSLFEFVASTSGSDAMRLLLSPAATTSVNGVTAESSGFTVLIGPEGGLTETEQEAALRSGFKSMRMGPRILRTETAAIAALSLLQHRFGDLGS
jgi:16S rRNA (uracil1498-N3)-methyltransferase